MKLLIALPLACAIGACTVQAPAPPASEIPRSVCDAQAAQVHVGHQATADMGAAILKDSHANTLRWGPPDSAWTMDMRPDRVNVRYDAGMTITEITCG